MPKEAKVFLAEDNKDFLDLEKEILEEHGHIVVLEAQTLEKALKNVKVARESGVNVAVLDGSLTDAFMARDGAKIAEALRKEVPGIKIVSCSGLEQDWGDVNLTKWKIEKIGEVVTKL